jgi:hypothetical protein
MFFEALFKGVSTRFGLLIVEKCFPGKRILKLCIPNEDLVRMNKDEIRISKEALFKGVSTLYGLRAIAKSLLNSVETPDVIFCSSFPNLRLGRIKIFVWGLRIPKEDVAHHVGSMHWLKEVRSKPWPSMQMRRTHPRMCGTCASGYVFKFLFELKQRFHGGNHFFGCFSIGVFTY